MLLSLVVPFFRTFRLVYAVRVLRISRVASTARFVRALTSGNRFLKALKEAQGPAPSPEMNVGLLISYSKEDQKNELLEFAQQMAKDVKQEMEIASGIKWIFHLDEAEALPSDDPKYPSYFLDSASLRMAEGPFDMVVVVTDVPLVSNKIRIEAGLASRVSRIVVISSRKLLSTSRGKPVRTLDAESVRWNAATLLLHLLGHISGLKHKQTQRKGLMAPYAFNESLTELPHFSAEEKDKMRKKAESLPERELHGGNAIETLIFHILMSFRHPLDILWPLLRNWAIFLPLSLPGLATAAVAPAVVLVFTAEIWDAGLNMPNQVAIWYALLSILGASFYLVKVQSLFLPRKEKRVLTEHLAVANTVIYLTILLACIGLFIMVTGLIFLIELYIFPEDLIATWPTLLNLPEVLWTDKLRLAAFISTLGVTTGALAGGLENKKVFHHLALFKDQP